MQDRSGVNLDILGVGKLLPVFPEEQTCRVFVGMSQTCQQRTKLMGWNPWSESAAVLGDIKVFERQLRRLARVRHLGENAVNPH
jgi:hypothetical protein